MTEPRQMTHWLVCGQKMPPDPVDWLHPDELALLAQLKNDRRRRDWLLGRWTAKLALIRWQNESSSQMVRLEIRANSRSAPEAYLDGSPMQLVISISHRAGLGLVAVSTLGRKLGCDVEWVEPRVQAFLEDCFTADERRQVEEAKTSGDLVANAIWSAKESVLKAGQRGLPIHPSEVAVSLGGGRTGDIWRPLKARHNSAGAIHEGWWRRYRGWVLTLVTQPATDRPIDLAPGS